MHSLELQRALLATCYDEVLQRQECLKAGEKQGYSAAPVKGRWLWYLTVMTFTCAEER